MWFSKVKKHVTKNALTKTMYRWARIDALRYPLTYNDKRETQQTFGFFLGRIEGQRHLDHEIERPGRFPCLYALYFSFHPACARRSANNGDADGEAATML